MNDLMQALAEPDRGGRARPHATARRRSLVGAMIALILTAAWLGLTAAPSENEWQFFGLWRTRHVLVAGAGLYLAAWAASRRGTIGLAVASVSGAGLLVLLEGIGLVGLVDYDAAFGQTRTTLGHFAEPGLDVSGTGHEDLSSMGYRTAPIPFHYRSDRRGYRNPEDLDAADIYMLGDSVLVAGLLPFEQTVTGLLAQESGRTTLNIALSGVGPQDERQMLLDSGLPLQNRLVLHFIFEGNDLLDSYAPQKEKSSPMPGHHRFLMGHVLALLRRMTDPSPPTRDRAFGLIDGRPYPFLWTNSSFEGHVDEVENIEAVIADLRHHVQEAGGRYAIVYMPAKIRVLGPFCRFPRESSIGDYTRHLNPMREPLLRWCEEQGVPAVDMTDPLTESARSGAIPWFQFDTHPNDIGHAVMADALLRFLATGGGDQ